MASSSVEVKFAQNLAANEKKKRDKSLKKLRKFLRLKSSKKGDDFLFSLMIFLTTSGHLFGYLLMIVFYTEMSSHHWIVKFYKMT